MTQNGNATPDEGREMEAIRSRADRKNGPREEREFHTGLLKSIIAALTLIVLIVFVVGGFVHYFGDDKAPVVVTTPTETTTTAEPVVDVEPDVDNEPLWPDGVHSWTQWEEVATSEMREALLEVAGVTPKQTQKWAAEELALGKDFQAEVDPGTPITNTGINDTGWYRVDSYLVREGDTLFLVTDKGIAAVKVSCGNPVAPAKPIVTEEPQPTPTPKPCPPPSVKGPNPYPDSVEIHQKSVPVPSPTPGYTSGSAERVVEEQQQSYPGNRESTPVGTDSGSTENPTNSRTTNPDGSYEDTKSGDEVETTPPSQEPVPSDDDSGFDPYAVP